jgi:hypothetical protein
VLTVYRLFHGGALDSQVTDSQFVNGLLATSKMALLDHDIHSLTSWNLIADAQPVYERAEPKTELEGA